MRCVAPALGGGPGARGPIALADSHIIDPMATARADREDQDHLTVAPIVGPEDPRRFTDSGIEISELYEARGRARAARTGRARRLPLHARGTPGDVPQAGLDDAPVRRLRLRAGVQRTLPVPALEGLDRTVDGLRPADPAGARLRQPEVPRRGRAHRGGDRHDRRHADRLRGDPARPGVHLDDDQRAGLVPAAALRAGGRGAGGAQREAPWHHPERRARRSTSPAATTSTRRSPRCGSPRTCSSTATNGCRAGTRSRSPATTSARRAARRCRRWPSRCPPASPTCRPRSTGACRWTSSPPGWRSSSTATTTSSRRWRSSGRPGGCGRRSCASASGPPTRRR